jgi:hypothetical protein
MADRQKPRSTEGRSDIQLRASKRDALAVPRAAKPEKKTLKMWFREHRLIFVLVWAVVSLAVGFGVFGAVFFAVSGHVFNPLENWGTMLGTLVPLVIAAMCFMAGCVDVLDRTF